ncbi:MAG TPA: hypothetical protein VME66_05865 [Candidatus Acidoferrales bacterium]|nr:hypothetical protein [Candidatus Acidoferrales bacterium]
MFVRSTLSQEIDALIAGHWEQERMRRELSQAQAQFSRDGFSQIAQLVPEAVRVTVERDVARCLERGGRRRNLRIRATAQTPRVYRSVDRDAVFAFAWTIPSLYRSPAFLRVLGELTGERDLIPSPYEPEEIVINCMERADDEHGWHWDDYRYSLVWVHKAPRRGNGGEVQFVPNTFWNKRDPQVEHYLRRGPVESRYIEEGAAYLIRGDILMHRVSPLREDDLRIITCFTYAGRDELDRDVSHETLEELYPSAAR